MSNQWFRSWHGAPTDPKWLAIAQRTQANASERDRTHINAGVVSAVWWALLDHASQADPRGSVEKFDTESYAAFSGLPATVVVGVVASLCEKKLIKDGHLAEWNKRQPKREDGSAERAKGWRERKRTQANADEHREDKRREDKDAAPPVVPPGGTLFAGEQLEIEKPVFGPPAKNSEAELFDRGREVLGKNAGGLVTKLLKAKGGKISLARAAIELASEKSDPREYIGGVIRGKDSPEDLRSRGEAW